MSEIFVAKTIFSEALRVRNSLRSLERRDKSALALEAVSAKTLDIAFTSPSLKLSRAIR